jgi:hypothetical protein
MFNIWDSTCHLDVTGHIEITWTALGVSPAKGFETDIHTAWSGSTTVVAEACNAQGCVTAEKVLTTP